MSTLHQSMDLQSLGSRLRNSPMNKKNRTGAVSPRKSSQLWAYYCRQGKACPARNTEAYKNWWCGYSSLAKASKARTHSYSSSNWYSHGKMQKITKIYSYPALSECLSQRLWLILKVVHIINVFPLRNQRLVHLCWMCTGILFWNAHLHWVSV